MNGWEVLVSEFEDEGVRGRLLWAGAQGRGYARQDGPDAVVTVVDLGGRVVEYVLVGVEQAALR